MRLAYGPGIREAIDERRGVVALESPVIAHGLPRPRNLETARLLEAEVRDAGAVPATICLADGMLVVGANDALLARLANAEGVAKISTRDLAPFLARVPGDGLGATTVATTAEIASRAGIEVVATGGIGGVHRRAERTMDVSADLAALARYPVVGVGAGAHDDDRISRQRVARPRPGEDPGAAPPAPRPVLQRRAGGAPGVPRA